SPALPSVSAAPPPHPEELSKVDRATLERRLMAAEKRLDELTPASEKWARGIRAPADEDRVRPYLDKLFEVKPNGPRPYDVECRDQICKISAKPDAGASPEWFNKIQSDPEAVRLFQWRSGGGNTVFMLLRDPRSGAQFSLMTVIATAFG